VKACQHCANPIKEFHRSQCMWMGEGTPPCEAEQYASDKYRTRVGCYLIMMVLAGIVFSFWQFH
jgi:hypothetical protein